jgi:hypothetical protein
VPTQGDGEGLQGPPPGLVGPSRSTKACSKQLQQKCCRSQELNRRLTPKLPPKPPTCSRQLKQQYRGNDAAL